MVSVVLFTRDLRIENNPCLARAAELGPVLPLFILDPQDWKNPNLSNRHYEFLRDCLASLSEDLAQLGQPLLIRTGPKREVLEKLNKRFKFSRIFSQFGPSGEGCPVSGENVAAWAEENAINWIQIAPDTPCEAPKALPHLCESPAQAPDSRVLGLPSEDRRGNGQGLGGRAQGLAQFERFLTARHSLPSGPADPFREAERRASRLGPWLAWGALSRHELRLAARTARQKPDTPEPARRELRRFERALGTALPSSAAPLTESAERPQASALTRGETGLPFIDASLRYLGATGWLPEPLRRLLHSFAALAPEESLPDAARQMANLLAREALDYDPAIHRAHIASPPQLLDPVRFGEAQDPMGRLIRRWLPELRSVPDAYLHRPWLSPEAQTLLDRRYPAPLFDPFSALQIARLREKAQRPPPARKPRSRPPEGQYSLAL